MSKHDTHFFNMFSLVLGILIFIAILLFVYARHVGSSTQAEHLKSESIAVAAIDQRTQPFSKVAVAGQDNSALAIKEPAPAGGAKSAFANGEQVYKGACFACHDAGVAGAPKFGDKGAWGARIAQGKDTLHKHAIQGFQGKAGVMPPKGGRTDLSDELVSAAVDYIIEHSR